MEIVIFNVKINKFMFSYIQTYEISFRNKILYDKIYITTRSDKFKILYKI